MKAKKSKKGMNCEEFIKYLQKEQAEKQAEKQRRKI
tara:strand:+ start:80 stop:187 length:108 start_codon:yes stop_codon:yes gene_type:complete